MTTPDPSRTRESQEYLGDRRQSEEMKASKHTDRPLPVNPTRPVSEVLKRDSFFPEDMKPCIE